MKKNSYLIIKHEIKSFAKDNIQSLRRNLSRCAKAVGKSGNTRNNNNNLKRTICSRELAASG